MVRSAESTGWWESVTPAFSSTGAFTGLLVLGLQAVRGVMVRARAVNTASRWSFAITSITSTLIIQINLA